MYVRVHERVCFSCDTLNEFECAHMWISPKECVCAVSPPAAVTHWGFRLNCKLTGVEENDRCEIMQEDGMENERTVALS